MCSALRRNAESGDEGRVDRRERPEACGAERKKGAATGGSSPQAGSPHEAKSSAVGLRVLAVRPAVAAAVAHVEVAVTALVEAAEARLGAGEILVERHDAIAVRVELLDDGLGELEVALLRERRRRDLL